MCVEFARTTSLLLLLLVPGEIFAALVSNTNPFLIAARTGQHLSATTGQIDNTAITTTALNSAKNSTSGVATSAATKFHLKWTPRTAWQAAPPLHAPTLISGAAGAGASTVSVAGVSHVIIHHTATPMDACQRSAYACAVALRAIQRTHQQQRGWDDIGYNFLIGGSDERAEIYEGRGFNVVGAHAVGYNARSVGIALIGDWTAALPSRPVLEKLKQLINYGVEAGYIQHNYKLLGHRQVKATACPGTRLFDELKTWPHFAQQ